ncbi:MAG: hypothetical protein LBL24_06035 [Bacteroidales bacterium]|jgi:hypothetical protein|nr:hypothetical protein [Bacteroidales bacterium]
MKKFLFFGCSALMALCVSCKDDDSPADEEKPEAIEVYTIDANGNKAAGTNRIVMINNGTGTSYWEHPLGTSTRAKDTIVVPFTGTYTVTFIENTINGEKKTPNEVSVTTLTMAVDPYWALLAGANGAGKTWVWATEMTNWYVWAGGDWVWEALEEDDIDLDDMTKPSFWNDKDDEFWEEYFEGWDEIDEDDMEGWFGALYNEMTFKFQGSSDFTLLVKASAEDEGTTTTDKFALDIKNRTLSNISQTPFLWSPWHWEGGDLEDINLEGEREISTYNILKLTENELIIGFVVDDEWFIWFFKAK